MTRQWQADTKVCLDELDPYAPLGIISYDLLADHVLEPQHNDGTEVCSSRDMI